jgi:hypothetical protein
MKKLLTLLFTAVLVFSLAMPVLAQEESPSQDEPVAAQEAPTSQAPTKAEKKAAKKAAKKAKKAKKASKKHMKEESKSETQ